MRFGAKGRIIGQGQRVLLLIIMTRKAKLLLQWLRKDYLWTAGRDDDHDEKGGKRRWDRILSRLQSVILASAKKDVSVAGLRTCCVVKLLLGMVVALFTFHFFERASGLKNSVHVLYCFVSFLLINNSR